MEDYRVLILTNNGSNSGETSSMLKAQIKLSITIVMPRKWLSYLKVIG